MDSNNRGDPDGDCDCDNEQGECSTDFSLILFLSRSNCVACRFTQSALAEILPCNVIYHATTLVTRRRRRRHLTAIPIHTTITSLFTISLIVTVYSVNLYLLAITLHQHLTIFIAILVVLNYFHPETPSAVAIHPRHPFLPHPPHHRPRVVVLDH